MTDQKKAPEQMTDADMDTVSGGPHFRNFHGSAFDFQSGCDVVLAADVKMTSETNG